mgnify:CR=1 FL=1
MKCISLWQPWASAVAIGSKRIETRSWSTKYRGPLLIHAAKRCHRGELRELERINFWRGAMASLLGAAEHMHSDEWLPFGALVAIADLVDCRPTSQFDPSELRAARRPSWSTSNYYDWCEADLGDFSAGRFGWVLENVRCISPSIPYRGFQQLFEVSESLLIDHAVLTGATA